MKSPVDLDANMKAGGEKRIDVLTLPGDSTNQHIISVAGSYYLSGPISGVSAKTESASRRAMSSWILNATALSVLRAR